MDESKYKQVDNYIETTFGGIIQLIENHQVVDGAIIYACYEDDGEEYQTNLILSFDEFSYNLETLEDDEAILSFFLMDQNYLLVEDIPFDSRFYVHLMDTVDWPIPNGAPNPSGAKQTYIKEEYKLADCINLQDLIKEVNTIMEVDNHE